ncbi:MAG: aromatic hydrocarbon degradation rane protein [Daejeonella sp.]|nr:aromatic hydrocarbon degradation rane protein [Daejeonella sp.]
MNFKKLIIFCALSASGYNAFAQYAADALRFSELSQGTTSRFKGLGSAQTALGGDLSSLSGNPAGLGMFTRSDIGFTTSFSSNKISSLYIMGVAETEKNKLGFNQLGVVFHATPPRPKGSDLEKGWVSMNFGIGYNKTNDLNGTVDYSGMNPTSSYADFLADDATIGYLAKGNPQPNTDNVLPVGSLARMAYDALLIEYNSEGYFPATSLNSLQRNVSYGTGSQSEVNFAFGANYSNTLYVGASVALSSLNYNVDRTFTERGANRNFPGQLPELIGGTYVSTYQSYQITEGSGVSGKLGLIFKPVDAFRFGLNFVAPTLYTVKDDFSESLNADYKRANGSSVNYGNNPEQLYQSDYRLRTPYKLNGGMAFIIKKVGLISTDVEYVDYSSIRFFSNDVATQNSNNAQIRDRYKGNMNFRAGAEVKLASIMLRGGVNYTGSPYKNLDLTSTTLSAGLGYRIDNLYFDFTFQNFKQDAQNTPYEISSDYADFQTTGSGATANLTHNRNSVFLTIGSRF